MKSIVRGGGLMAGAALLLSGCGSFDGQHGGGPAASPAPAAAASGVTDVPVTIGEPYKIGGVSYTPTDVADYDEVGYAGWYGDETAGKPTANGETFDPAAISAAHKTLPLPSYVEVTALDTGRTILVRVNDRGPMVNDRLIDLSRGAAEQLGIADGVTAVRVRRTNPPAAERALLRAGKPVRERIATPQSLLAILRGKVKELPVPKTATASAPASPATASATGKAGEDRFIVESPGTKMAAPEAGQATKPATTATKPAAAGSYFVQVGAFSTESRAEAAAKSVGGHVSKAGRLWRVRMGPFTNDTEARRALTTAKARGFRDALVQRNR
ncbi:Rare lipoprotein A [uncultured Sphingopyxis sp.]|uniref:Endolytic peptidoglycan transglycosylase RlpA n=1 Tax=uncultured Sphingopyxis sp. TaxID=310581 RepID=A0A1Y5PSQ3_9SPHN|nr:septal ring lytic transglycosylase RlpA family protein [uncultured Sphingopyxis sp.]SBV33043.1 Rare lipoprotein A [uncultured Sphingopyxis sp.]